MTRAARRSSAGYQPGHPLCAPGVPDPSPSSCPSGGTARGLEHIDEPLLAPWPPQGFTDVSWMAAMDGRLVPTLMDRGGTRSRGRVAAADAGYGAVEDRGVRASTVPPSQVTPTWR